MKIYSQKELQTFIESDKKYIVKYNDIFEIRYNKNLGSGEFYLYKLHTYEKGGLPLTKRGRHIVINYKQVNELLGYELLVA